MDILCLITISENSFFMNWAPLTEENGLVNDSHKIFPADNKFRLPETEIIVNENQSRSSLMT